MCTHKIADPVFATAEIVSFLLAPTSIPCNIHFISLNTNLERMEKGQVETAEKEKL